MLYVIHVIHRGVAPKLFIMSGTTKLNCVNPWNKTEVVGP